ncbi:MAG: PilZ domain-containing protein [Brevinematia bacterium]
MINEEIIDNQKIRSFLKRLRSANATVEVIYKNQKTKGSIRFVSEYSFEMFIQNPLQVTEPTIDIELPFENRVYHFQTELLNSKENTLLLMLPSKINVWLKRKYPRKNVYGQLFINISFIKPLESIEIIDINKIPENLRELKIELNKDNPDVKKVITMVIKEIEKITPNYDIILYKRGMTLPSSAIISRIFQKPLIVEDTSNLESYITMYDTFDIATYGDYMRKMAWSENKVMDQVKKLRSTFLSQNIKSFICVPIKVINDVIGFIFCRSADRKFSIKDVLYLDALSNIISEAYIKNKINSLKNAKELQIPVIDISAGGIRFEVDSILGKILKVDDSIRILLQIQNKSIQALGKIIRIDNTKNNKKLWVAAVFTFISPEDQQFILSFTTK